jgi:FMN reductase
VRPARVQPGTSSRRGDQGLGGSLRTGSTSLAALQITLEAAAKAGAWTRLFTVRELDLPMYRPDMDTPPAAQALLEATATAQGMVWSSPLYNGSVSGSFKNVIDWLHRLGDRDPPYLTDRVIGLVTTAGGTQGLQASTPWSSSSAPCAPGRCRWCCP